MLLSFYLVSCTSTIKPTEVTSKQASFDANAQNSGVIGEVSSGFIVTPHFIARYDTLVGIYGRDFKPAIEAGDGTIKLSDGTFQIDREHMVKFLEMQAWARAGLKPLNP